MKNNARHNGKTGINPYIEIQHRSDEVQDMIGSVPHWLVRTGISLICMVLIVLLTISWFVRYPDILRAEVLITTDPAPVTLVARSSGSILVLAKEKQKVKEGDILGVIQSPEDWQAILQLEKELMINGLMPTPGELANLGSLQDHYNRYLLAKSQWHLFSEADHYKQQILQMQKQLATHEKLKVSLARQLKLTKAQQALAIAKFRMDSALFVQTVMSRVDFQQSTNTLLQSKKELERTEASLINQELRIEELQAALTKLKIDEQSERNRLQQTLINAKNELLAQIGDWKTAHLFIAPEEGKISYLDILHDNKHIQTSQALFSLVPDQGEIMAIATLPVAGSGKVATGQRVNIKLDHYPHEQYGMLQGVIIDFPMMPVEGYYQVKLSLPDKLKTTYGKKLSIRQNLTGQTEVITEELRLMEKMFHWVRSIRYRLQ